MRPAHTAGSIRVVAMDDAIVVADKPSGLAVHAGWAKDPVVAVDLVSQLVGETVHPVHRLDRATSGLLVFARTALAARTLSESLAAGAFEKMYLALVRGHPAEQGEIDHPIPRRPDGPRVEARTSYRRLGTFERFALVAATPHTGRLHQVRRHLKHLGHPLVGDVNYGRGEINRDFRARFGLNRLVLHAGVLSFPHPRSGARVRHVCPLGEDLRTPFAEMGLLGAAEAALA